MESDTKANDCKDDETTITKHATELASLETCLLSVQVAKDIQGTIRLGFSKSVSIDPQQLRRMVNTVLWDSRMEITDFASWTPTIDGATAEIKVELSADDLQDIVDLLESLTHWLVDSQRMSQLTDLKSTEATGYASEQQRTVIANQIVDHAFGVIREPLVNATVVFLGNPINPTTFYQFEILLLNITRQFARIVLQAVVQSLEPDEPRSLPRDVLFECGG